jgi:TRAP transporter TAXI family solute receptor
MLSGEETPAPRRALRVALLVALGAGLAAGGVAGYGAWSRSRAPLCLRIATGPPGGTYLPLGQAIAEVLRSELPGAVVEAIETAGGPDNVERLGRGEVELALVQNDTPGGPDVRAIAPLYQEVLQVVVREKGGIDGPLDLRGKRVATGPARSGTEGAANRVFAHFGIAPGEVEVKKLTHHEAAEAFARGEVDAVFVLAGLRAEAVERLLREGGARLLSLGDPQRAGSPLEGIRIDAPFLDAAVIPEGAYGALPREPVGTLGVRALLVCRAGLDQRLVRRITQAIFENKVLLGERERVVARLSEHFDPGEIRFPVHPGAMLYYQRDNPPVILAWADTISLFITVALLVGSGGLAVREWIHRRKKNRIDVYYLEIQFAACRAFRGSPLEDLLAVKEQLLDLRRRAFRELIAEQLEANESFTIFQDYLESELRAVDALIAEARRADEAAAAAVPPPLSPAEGGGAAPGGGPAASAAASAARAAARAAAAAAARAQGGGEP